MASECLNFDAEYVCQFLSRVELVSQRVVHRKSLQLLYASLSICPLLFGHKGITASIDAGKPGKTLGCLGQLSPVSFSVISCRDPLFNCAIVGCSVVSSAAPSLSEFQIRGSSFISESVGGQRCELEKPVFFLWAEIAKSLSPLDMGRG